MSSKNLKVSGPEFMVKLCQALPTPLPLSLQLAGARFAMNLTHRIASAIANPIWSRELFSCLSAPLWCSLDSIVLSVMVPGPCCHQQVAVAPIDGLGWLPSFLRRGSKA